MKPSVVGPATSHGGRASSAGGGTKTRRVDAGGAATNGHDASAVWTEWGRVTRFLESARLAFARERNLWTSLEIESAEQVKLAAPTGRGSYRVRLSGHLAAVQDEDMLLGSVLIHSYALAETAAMTVRRTVCERRAARPRVRATP